MQISLFCLAFVIGIPGVKALKATPVSIDEEVKQSKQSISLWQMESVGEDASTGRKPSGEIMSLTPFSAYSFFEVHPDQLEASRKIHVELYAGAGKDKPCDSGVLLETSEVGAENQIMTTSFPFDSYDSKFKKLDGLTYPSTSNGRIGAALFVISDFRELRGDRQIYFPNKGEKDGQIEMCVRISLKADYNGDSIERVVSLLDTHWNIAVNLSEIIAEFTNMDTQGDARTQMNDRMTDLNTDANENISVQAYLCDENNNKLVKPKYTKSDKEFSICVDLGNDADDENYMIEGFKALTCKNTAETRMLVDNYSPDMLTSVDNTVDTNGVRAVRSVMTDAFLNGDAGKFDCDGEVLVRVKEGRLEQLQEKQGPQGRRSRNLIVNPSYQEELLSPFQIEVFVNPRSIGSRGRWAAFSIPIAGVFVGFVVVVSLFYKKQVEEEKVSSSAAAVSLKVEVDIEAVID